MSAIFGVYSPRLPAAASTEHLAAMRAALAHRGGDGEATHLDPEKGIAVGHLYRANFRRPGEAVLPALAAQGARVATIDGQVLNLESQPVVMPAPGLNADAGVVLARFGAGPEAFPEGLEGYFALAVWDEDSRSLVLAQDPMGRKPLHYYSDPARGLFVFASELKGVLAHPLVPREIDPQALSLFLSLGYVPPPFSIVKGVRKLIGGERLTVSERGDVTTRQYWRLVPPPKGPDALDYWLPKVGQEIEEALTRVSASTPRLALFLSGGVDSSVMLPALAKNTRFKAYTIAFRDDPSTYDLPWAEQAAKAVGCDHEVLLAEPADITPGLMATLFRQMDEPFHTSSRAVTDHFLLEAAQRDGYDSVLIGSGAEWVFDGTRRYRDYVSEHLGAFDESAMLQELLGKAPYIRLDEQQDILTRPIDQDPLPGLIARQLEEVQGLEGIDALLAASAIRGSTGRLGVFNTIIPPLTGQEIRSPFYDETMLRFALSTPSSLRGSESRPMEKVLIKRFGQQTLGIDFNAREKRALPGFPRPAWLVEAIADSVLRLGQTGIFKPEYTADLARRARKGRARQDGWLLFSLQCWIESYLEPRDLFSEYS